MTNSNIFSNYAHRNNNNPQGKRKGGGIRFGPPKQTTAKRNDGSKVEREEHWATRCAM